MHAGAAKIGSHRRPTVANLLCKHQTHTSHGRVTDAVIAFHPRVCAEIISTQIGHAGDESNLDVNVWSMARVSYAPLCAKNYKPRCA